MPGLLDHLRRRIAHEGPLSISQYMEVCLAHPELGYYMTRDPLGAAGDFTTAPEISQMFGELIGLWAAQVWLGAGVAAPPRWVELGPGRGTLSADALRAMAGVRGLADDVRVHLVETSPVLRACQAAALGPWRPVWHEMFSDVPAGPAIVVANEFFDALPVRQFQRLAGAWRERMVTMDGAGNLAFTLIPPLAMAPRLPVGLDDIGEGEIVEVSVPSITVMRALADRLRADGAAALVIDYGHARSAPGDTLQAVKDHAYHDVLSQPGTADLTAHVDFGALAEAARSAGAAVHGPVAQGDFLRALGIEVRADRLRANATPGQGAEIDSALERLTAPEAMGRMFKVMAVTAPGSPVPAGFEG